VSRADSRTVVETLPDGHEPAFVVQLLHRVREYGLGLSAVRIALDEDLSSRQTTAEETIRGEHQRQGVAQVSMANAVTSLRLCATLDWQEYVESVSLVERVLQRDPAGAYARMDFLSRDAQRRDRLQRRVSRLRLRTNIDDIHLERERCRWAPSTHSGEHRAVRPLQRLGLEALRRDLWPPAVHRTAGPDGSAL